MFYLTYLRPASLFIPEKQCIWVEFFAKILGSNTSCPPKGAAPPEREEVHVVVFADSSLSAFCAVAYAVWTLPEGSSELFVSVIIMAKRRLSPKAGTSTLGAELSSLQLARRLGYVVADEAIYTPASLSIIRDSE